MKLIYDITRQDYADFNKFHFFSTQFKKRVILLLLLLVILQLALNFEEFDIKMTLFSSIIAILVYYFVILIVLKRTKNIPDNAGAILGQKELEFTEDRISFKTANSEGSSEWRTMKKLEESSTAFYLYMDTNMAMMVPKRAFDNKSNEDEFRELVLRKINSVKHSS